MHTLDGGFTAPVPPIFSLATGGLTYNDYNTRATLQQWVDHPQRLWSAIYYTLASGVDTVVHVGPEPNLIPATFRRLSENVVEQTTGSSWGSLGMRAVSRIARLQWLKNVLPERTALLRAPQVRHIILEDWLLDQKVE
jgi:[acyl-carrier-protein] S-malonyltransferase